MRSLSRSRTMGWSWSPSHSQLQTSPSTTRDFPTRRSGLFITTRSLRHSSTANGGTPTSGSTSGSPTARQGGSQRRRGVGPGLPGAAVPGMLRRQRPDLRIGFFLHIPFPPTELFLQLPWRGQILEGLLGADLVGFQLPGGAQNLSDWFGTGLAWTRCGIGSGCRTAGRCWRGPIQLPSTPTPSTGWRRPKRLRNAPLRSVDLGDPQVMFLGVDRLDYTKGLLERIQAFGELIAEERDRPGGGRTPATRHPLTREGRPVPATQG